MGGCPAERERRRFQNTGAIVSRHGYSGAMNAPTSVVIREVGLRDGLQILPRVLPTAHKFEWLRAAHAAGLREIEVGSFVPAKLMPQLADTAELVAFAKTLPGLLPSVLVPNLKGAERAIEVSAHAMLVPLSASHAHSLANLRKTPDEVVAEIGRIRAARDAAGSATLIEVGLSTAFGCTIQGHVEPAEVLRLMQAVLDAGVDRVGLADTVGYADTLHVGRLFAQARQAPSGRDVRRRSRRDRPAHSVQGRRPDADRPDRRPDRHGHRRAAVSAGPLEERRFARHRRRCDAACGRCA